MARTVVALFDTLDEAQATLDDLHRNGIAFDDISLVSHDERARSVGDRPAGAEEGALGGALGGGVLGGVLGMLIGIGALTIPGIGPILAAGPLAAALGSVGAATVAGAGLGAAGGGLLGALVGAGLPESEAHLYAEGIRRGGTLVMVRTDDRTERLVASIIRSHAPADVDARGQEWRAGGWNRFDEQAGPYNPDRYYSAGTGPGSQAES